MELGAAFDWLSERKTGVLITIRRDGRPQSSDVSYFVDGDRLGISITDGRAKTANMRRDPRVVVHVSEPSSWSYVSLDGEVELMPVTSSVDDATNDELVRYYRAVAGEHPDWDEYRTAMVSDGRLIAWFRPSSAVGQIAG
jgi:PPOX class probable F420-dependent enzyme